MAHAKNHDYHILPPSIWPFAGAVSAFVMLYGAVPNGVSIVAGNLLLSCVLVGMIAAIYQFQGRPVRWWLLLLSPVLVTAFVIGFVDNFPARVSFVGLVIGLQAVWALSAALERRHATVGRGQWLLVAGLALEAIVLGGRALVAITANEAASSILQSSVLQTLTFMSTFTVVLVSSMAHWLPFPRAEAYGASKAALSWFADSLRLDWEPKGIAVTVISPGFVDTPLTRKNDFAMPGRVSVDEAVKAIRSGLAKGKMHIAFPTRFGFILRLLSRLPAFLQRTLLRRMVRS